MLGHSSDCTQICRADGEGRFPPRGHQHHPGEGAPGGTGTCGQPGCEEDRLHWVYRSGQTDHEEVGVVWMWRSDVSIHVSMGIGPHPFLS